jgi:hypothetical protein
MEESMVKILLIVITLLVSQPTLGEAMEVTVTKQGNKFSYTVHNQRTTSYAHTMQIEHGLGVPLHVEGPVGWDVVSNNGKNVMWYAGQNRDYWIRPGASLEGFVVYGTGVENEGVYFVQGTDNALSLGQIAVPVNAKSTNKDPSGR